MLMSYGNLTIGISAIDDISLLKKVKSYFFILWLSTGGVEYLMSEFRFQNIVFMPAAAKSN